LRGEGREEGKVSGCKLQVVVVVVVVIVGGGGGGGGGTRGRG
jgi:hypothetical protein